jgi:sugar phosphate isomerase/epimerase
MEKTWKWAVTGYNLPYKTHEEIVSICRYAGISAVEANVSFVHEKRDIEIEKIREQYEKASLKTATFHLPMGLQDDISCFYETLRRPAVKLMEKLIEKASLLGSRIVILHPSSSLFNVEDEGIERYMSQIGKSLETIIPAAEKNGIIVALENMLPGKEGHMLGSDPEHFTLFKRKFAHKNLGFCLDTGHALVAGGQEGPARFFEVMSENLKAFHIQDNAGDRDSHLAPGRGLIDWKTVFGKMKRIRFSGIACIEAPPFSYGPHHTQTIEAWKKLVDETNALAETS